MAWPSWSKIVQETNSAGRCVLEAGRSDRLLGSGNGVAM